MPHRILSFLMLMAVTLTATITHAAREADIAIVVNDDVISKMDVNNRLDLIIASTGFPNTQETRTKLLPQVSETLIMEQIQFQEAKKREIEITEQEVDKAFAELAASNKMTADQFLATLRKNKASIPSIRNQIKSRLSWNKSFSSALRGSITITNTDIDSVIARTKDNIGKTEYFLSEIFLPIDDPKQEDNVKQLAFKVVNDISTKGAPFAAVARQLSKAPGAEQGGIIGWVTQSQLDPEIAPVIEKMPAKSMTKPLKSSAGYHIYFINDTREITEKSIPSREQIQQSLFMRRAERASANKLQNLRNAAYIDNRLIDAQ